MPKHLQMWLREPLESQVTAWADAHGIVNFSDAVRALLSRGLQHEETTAKIAELEQRIAALEPYELNPGGSLAAEVINSALNPSPEPS